MVHREKGDTMNGSYNTLIAGVIGSGKSYTEKLIIQKLMDEGGNQFVLIDPKKVELHTYRRKSGVLWYADEEDDIYEALCCVYELMDMRLERMREKGLLASDEPHVYVFVDEMAFLMQSNRKREYVQMFNKITLLGRAARIHLILCTQVSTQDVIPACIRDNMTNIVCLRQRDAGKYRYLLGSAPGRLPTIGYGYVFTPDMERPEKVKTNDVYDKIWR